MRKKIREVRISEIHVWDSKNIQAKVKGTGDTSKAREFLMSHKSEHVLPPRRDEAEPNLVGVSGAPVITDVDIDKRVILEDGDLLSVKVVRKLTAEDLARLAPRTYRPPNGYLVELMMPAHKAADFLDQMAEIYPSWVEKYGENKARWIWRSQSAQAVLGNIINYLLKVGGKLWPGILQSTSKD